MDREWGRRVTKAFPRRLGAQRGARSTRLARSGACLLPWTFWRRGWLGLLLALLSVNQLCVHRALAEPRGRYDLRIYTSEDGLESQSTFFLNQDPDGFIWAATEDGLFRYDGRRFERFGEPQGMPSDAARILHTDGFGRTWVGTLRGLARWDGKRFQSFGEAQGIPLKEVRGLAHGPDGRLWAAADQRPYRFTAQERFEPVPGWNFGFCKSLSSSPGSATAGSSARSSGERVWAVGYDDSPSARSSSALSYEAGVWRVWPFAGGAPREILSGILEDAAGRVWARGSKTLWVREPGAEQFTLFTDTLPATDPEPRMNLDAQGRLLVSTSAGLYWLEGSEWHVISEAQGLPARWLRHAMVDREGSLWLAGMSVYRVLGRSLWQNYTTKEGLPGEFAWAVIRARSGRLWVGTNRGVAYETDSGWVTVPGTENYRLQSIVETPDGSILSATNVGEIFRWDPQHETLEVFAEASRLSGGKIFHMELDRSQTLWVATGRGGVLRAAAADPRRLERVELPGGKPDEMFIGITVGPTGRIWASGENGLAMLEAGRWRRFTREDGLLADQLMLSLERASGDVLTAYVSAKGLTRSRFEDGKFKILDQPEQNGTATLPPIYSLFEDSRGWLWIGSARGVTLRTPFGEDQFTQRDGLPSEDINNMAVWQDRGGDVWFGTAGGLGRFHAARYQGPIPPPVTWLTLATLGETALPTNAAPTGSTAVLEVPRVEGNLRTQFSSLSFAGESKLQYEGRLSGVDANWHSIDGREARYPGLPPNDYVFEVRSRVGQGPWGVPARVAFRVLPAWYELLWFRALAVLAGLGLVALGVRLRLRTLRKRNEQLEALVNARTSQLQTANDNMRLVLDNVDQGLAMLNPAGDMVGERSLAFENWFGAISESAHFAAHVMAGDAAKESALRAGYEQLMEDLLPIELSLDQIPAAFSRDQRHYALSFKPLIHGERIDAALMMVSDVTAQVEARRVETVQQEQFKVFQRLNRDRRGFSEFISEASALVEHIGRDAFATPTERMRAVHTLTGSAALFDAVTVADQARRFEQVLSDGESERIVSQRAELLEAWRAFAARIAPLLETPGGRKVELDDAELDALIDSAAQGAPALELARQLKDLRGEPVSAHLSRIGEQIQTLAARLGKGDVQVVIRANALRLSPAFYGEFWSSSAHIVRNIVDHGFQDAAERARDNKPPSNRVELSAEAKKDRLSVEIADDGKGVNWERLAEKARALGLPHAERSQLVAALFHGGLTSADHVGENSGRGVGMSAVAQVCQRLGGSVSVTSEVGQGTRLRFDLPLVRPHMDTMPCRDAPRPALATVGFVTSTRK